jgi:hypothetical protein
MRITARDLQEQEDYFSRNTGGQIAKKKERST